MENTNCTLFLSAHRTLKKGASANPENQSQISKN